MGCCELGNGPEHGLLSRVWSAAQSQPCEPRRQGGRAAARLRGHPLTRCIGWVRVRGRGRVRVFGLRSRASSCAGARGARMRRLVRVRVKEAAVQLWLGCVRGDA